MWMTCLALPKAAVAAALLAKIGRGLRVVAAAAVAPAIKTLRRVSAEFAGTVCSLLPGTNQRG
jgi:hypothetical protein